MTDREKVIKGLEKVSYYFKSLLAVGWQGDADIYREHMETVNMARALLKEHGKKKFFIDSDGKITPLPDVVLCKDCKHFNDMKCSYPERGTCDLWHMMHWGEWFCADGERR